MLHADQFVILSPAVYGNSSNFRPTIVYNNNYKMYDEIITYYGIKFMVTLVVLKSVNSCRRIKFFHSPLNNVAASQLVNKDTMGNRPRPLQ